MKQKTKWKIIVLLLVLCVSMLISAFMLNYDFSKLTAYAEETTTSSVEDSLSFTLFNNGTEYKVKARNKKITEVEIPHQYNGLPVTEVSDNAFVSCTNLRSVRVPFTVKRIGTNAFYNCSNLEEINGMARVEKIGNNAFANCSKLDNVILPSTITSLGSTILRSNSKTVYSRLSEEDMTALNPNWKLSNHPGIVVYGNGLVIDGVYDENDELQGYAIKHDQNLFAEDVDFVLGDTYNGLPLLEIEREGFSGCTFKSFTLRHGEICPDAIDTEESSPIAFSEEDEECNHVVNIASNAFIGMQADEIKILVDITLIDHTNVDNVYEFENGYSSSVFCSSTARTIILPNSLEVIPSYMFMDCGSLREILSTDKQIDVNHISDKITSIGTNAFAGCTEIINLYIGDVKNMGESVFWQWGGSEKGVHQTIHLEEYFEAPTGEIGYNWSFDWLGEIEDKVEVKFKTITVVLDKDGGKENVGTNYIEAMYNQDMPEAEAPEKDYFIFGGYYSERNGQGTPYYDGDMNSVTPWDKLETSSIYANWIPKPFTVEFDRQGGEGGSDSVENCHYLENMPEEGLKAPIKIGYAFEGYYSLPEGQGAKYYNSDMTSAHAWDLELTKLYANWEIINYIATLNPQGGSDGSTEVTNCNFNISMPIGVIAPQRAGYTFDGYYAQPEGKGTQYYNADMTSANVWDIADNSTLYANWINSIYKITFDMQGGKDGSRELDVTFDKMADSGALVPPKKPGNIFKGYYAQPEGEGNKYYNEDMKCVHVWDIPESTTLYAYWVQIPYTIQFEKQGGEGGTDSYGPVYYGDSLPEVTAPKLIGWTFMGYYSEENGAGKQYYNADMTGMFPYDTEANLTLYANWERTIYTLTFDKQDGEGSTDSYSPIHYEDSLPEATAPKLKGRTFKGYYSEPNGEGKQYYNADMMPKSPYDIDANLTVYANWERTIYTLTFDKQNGEGSTDSYSPIHYEDDLPEATAPTFKGWTFKGYYSEPNGEGKQYYNADMNPMVEYYDVDYELTVYADWEHTEYTLTFDKQGGEGGTDSYSPIHYEDDLPEATAPTKKGRTFKGYYSEPNGEGKQYYDADMNPMVEYYDVDYELTVYADWGLIKYTLRFDKQGGTGGTAKCSPVYYGYSLPEATAPRWKGHIFNGYYSEPNGEGKQYYDADMNPMVEYYDVDYDLTVYADWEYPQFTLTLINPNEVEGKVEYKLYYGEVLPEATAPKWTGKTFKGYFTEPEGKGKKYYDANMKPQCNYEIEADLTLYPHKIDTPYKITFDKQGGTGGKDSYSPIHYGEDLPEATAPKYPGKTFNGYYTETECGGIQYYDATMTAKIKYYVDDNLTLYAGWIKNKYEVKFDFQGGEGGSESVKVTFEEENNNSALVAPFKTGSIFEGYYTKPEGQGTKYYNADMTSAQEWDIPKDTTLYANWVFIDYTAILDPQGGTGGSAEANNCHYKKDMPEGLVAPTRIGYTFDGYYAKQNGEGTKYYNANMTSAHKWDIVGGATLYANWINNVYKVTLLTNKGYITVDATFDKEMPEVNAGPASKVGYTNGGYYYNGVKYYNDDLTSAHIWNVPNDVILNIDFINNIYKVTLLTDEGYITVDATFDKEMPEVNAGPASKVGYTNGGYYYNGVKYYNGDLTSANIWDVPSDVMLETEFKLNDYSVKLEMQGGTGGTEFVICNYGHVMPSGKIAPTKPYSTFEGYYDQPYGQGTKYYNADMTSAHKWDKEEDATLYASWKYIQFNIEYELNGGINDPLNPTSITVNDIKTLRDAIDEVRPFLGWYLNGKKVTTLSDITEDIVLVAEWDKSYDKIFYDGNESLLEIDSNNVVILVLPDSTDWDLTLCVFENVSRFVLIGNSDDVYSIDIAVFNRETTISIELRNISIKARTTNVIRTYSEVDLNLYTYGNVVLEGADCYVVMNSIIKFPEYSSPSGHEAISCYNLRILHADNLTIKGADGPNGGKTVYQLGSSPLTIKNGGDGAHAIRIEGERLEICSNVKIIGGNGGNGVNGTKNTNGTTTSEAGKGGRGAEAIYYFGDELQIIEYPGSENIQIIDGKDGENGRYVTSGGGGDVIIPNPPIVDPPIIGPVNPILPTN